MSEIISVIIPVYNVEKYLVQCIESVRNQTYHNLEIILVDDGSPDQSGKICDKYADIDSRISVIHKKNEGLGYARNSGLEQASGKYILFIDSDDWIEKNHVEKLVSSIEETKSDIIVHGFQYRMEGKSPQKIHPFKIGEFENIVQDILLPMVAANIGDDENDILPVGSWCKLYKRSIIMENNLSFINEKECISEDVMFNVDYLRCCKKVCVIDECGYNYRMNPNSISNAYDSKRTSRMFQFFKCMDYKFSQDMRLNTKESMYNLDRCYIAKARVGFRLIAKSNISIKEKRYEINRILSNERIMKALCDFPLTSYSKHLYLISVLMKMKLSWLILLVYLAK